MRKESVNAAFFFILLGVLVVVGFLVVAPILDFMLLGFLLAIGFYPVHRGVRRLVRHEGSSAFITIGLVSAVVLVPMVFVAISLIEDLQGVVEHLSIEELEAGVGTILGIEDDRTARVVGSFVIPKVTAFLESLAVDLAGILARMVIGLMVLTFVMFYALAEGPRMVDTVRQTLPLKTTYKERLIKETQSAVYAIFFGQILISIIHGIVLGAAFWWFGFPSPVFWAFVTIIVSILPVVGTPAIWVPAGLWLASEGDIVGAILFMGYAAVVSTGFVEHWLKFKMIGRMAKIHPLIVLVGVVGGIGVFGMSGFMIGPLVLAILVSFVRSFSQTYQEDPNYVFL
ncbi:MAG: AI-2E family transporter [Euryarchaeota archaeon]|nr:AI-2E family transporter [Euryarchaeota archaeon]